LRIAERPGLQVVNLDAEADNSSQTVVEPASQRIGKAGVGTPIPADV
jgi:hypothetical protein